MVTRKTPTDTPSTAGSGDSAANPFIIAAREMCVLIMKIKVNFLKYRQLNMSILHQIVEI